MAGKKTSASDKARHAVYKSGNIFAKNKVAKLERHLKQFPNDEIAIAALKKAPTATSSRWGTKDFKSLRTNLERIVQPIERQIRKANRVYATVRDGDALVLNGVLFSSDALKEKFGIKATEKRSAPAEQKTSKVRRGKRKSA